MSSDKSVVVLGATGYVGIGVVSSYLEKGFRVFAVSRSSTKLDTLKSQLSKNGSSLDNLIPVVGDFANAAQAHKVLDDVHRHGEFSHVVSILGFVDLIMKAASETTPEELIKNWEDSFFLNVRASNAFVPTLKKKANASFTVVSGGLAHGVFVPQAWAATVKNGLLNVWAMTLEAELKETSVHFNNVCIHFGVAPPGQELNQLGMPASDTRQLGAAFVALATSGARRGTICLNTIADAQSLTKELTK